MTSLQTAISLGRAGPVEGSRRCTGGKFKRVRVDAILVAMEAGDTDQALSHPQCPMEPNMSEVTVVVAVLLILVLVHGVLAALERPTTPLSRHKRVIVTTSHTISSRKARNSASHSTSTDQPQPCNPDTTTGTSKKTVRFVEVPSIQRIQPMYTQDDFYNDPPIVS